MLLRDTDPRFRALPWKLALFGLSALLGAILIVASFAWRQGYFEAKTPLTFISDNGNDLKLGMAVKYSGFKIGEVTDLRLDDRGRVRIGVRIEDRHLKWIKSDSIGKVGKEGLIGDGYIDVGLGDPRLPPVKADAELEFMPARSMDEILGEVRDRAMPVFNEVEALIRRINDPQGDLNQSLANLRQFSAGLNDTRARLDAVLTSANGLATQDVPATLASTRQVLERADQSLRQIESRLPGMLKQAEGTLSNLEAASGATRKLIDQASPEAVGLIQDSRELARKGSNTVDALTEAWPLNRLIAPAPAEAPRSDSQGVMP